MTAADTVAALAASASRAARMSDWRIGRAEAQQRRKGYLLDAAQSLPERSPERARWFGWAEYAGLKAVALTALAEGEPAAARKIVARMRECRRVLTRGVVA